jgi:predicted TPR repeat methyltransferase
MTGNPVESSIDRLASLKGKVEDLLGRGRFVAALALLAGMEKSNPEDHDVLRMKGRALLASGKNGEALIYLDRVVALGGINADIFIHRAAARSAAGDRLGALDDAAHAVEIDSGYAAAQACLGIALIEANSSLEDAADLLFRAYMSQPSRIDWGSWLARALDMSGREEQAEEVLSSLIRVAPMNPTPWRVRALCFARKKDWPGMETICRAAEASGIRDPNVTIMLGNSLMKQGKRSEAMDAFEVVSKLMPNDTYVQHLLASEGRIPAAERAPDAYVSAIFDGYANDFDGHLLRLGYRVPGAMRKILLDVAPFLFDAPDCDGFILDLGCGTGLMAVALGDLKCDGWVGVDLSAGMLAQARGRGLYHSLRHEEIHNAMASDLKSYRLVIAADVLCYLGDLSRFFALAASRLKEEGILIVSFEAASPDRELDFVLQPGARYAHSETYFKSCATNAGLRAKLYPEVIRDEADAPVRGFIAVCCRASSTIATI